MFGKKTLGKHGGKTFKHLGEFAKYAIEYDKQKKKKVPTKYGDKQGIKDWMDILADEMKRDEARQTGRLKP